MSYRIRIATAAIAGLLLASLLSAQGWAGRGRLSGTVEDSEGKSVQGATVKLTMDGAGPDEVQTDRRGRWAKGGLRSGDWIVLVSKTGFVPTEHAVTINEYATGADRPVLKTQLRQAEGAGLTDDAGAQAARALLEQGNGLLAVEDFEGAIAVFSEALPSLPDGAKASVLVIIAQNQIRLERDDEAIANLEKALALAPENVDALRLMSRRLTALGRSEEAQRYLARLPEDLQADPEILLREGVDLYNQNDFAGAVEKLTAAIEGEPEWADAYYYRGLARMAATQNEAAAEDFRKLIELAPDDPRAEEAKQFAEYLESL
ncbi:MAG: tetratricopeptide repeat protein [Holophagales bacterium]|nr:tetratricopeptide repeat protein [Holophagales bacterium]MYG30243.1 tetratricopeptide repeat protein [Holophagales bacterium]MYI81015.1 tetratricopeptide repeat protein [Holophagales bacterium]